MADWAPFYREIVKAVPENKVLLWRLMYRDPQPNYSSPCGRVVQIGDAAHPFLPTSGTGAGIALEDGCSLAACLQLAGKQNIQVRLLRSSAKHLLFAPPFPTVQVPNNPPLSPSPPLPLPRANTTSHPLSSPPASTPSCATSASAARRKSASRTAPPSPAPTRRGVRSPKKAQSSWAAGW